MWAAGAPYPYGAEFAVTVANGKLYAPGTSGEFHAMDASTGEALWSVSVGMGSESPPTVVDGVVYLTAVNTAYALDEATGEEIWSYGTELFPAVDHPAVVVDGVYYFAPDTILYALDAASGDIMWSYEADDLITDVPVVAEGMVLREVGVRRFPRRGRRHRRPRMELGDDGLGVAVAYCGQRLPDCRVQRWKPEGTGRCNRR